MDPRPTSQRSIRPRLIRLGAILAVATMAALALGAPVVADSHTPAPVPSGSPAPNPELQISARALLDGHVRPGAWTAVDVVVSNSGPPINGELRIRGPQQGRSQYGVEVSLATNARQQFTLYAQAALFGSRLNVDLASGDQVLATQQVSIRSHDIYTPIVAVVAERPEGILAAVNGASVNPNVPSSSVITLGPDDLPPRVEAWSAIDRLVWQDVDAAQLDQWQLGALRLWLGAGGRLVVLGGTTGTGTLAGFTDLLPFDASHTVDAQPADLAALLGSLPAGAQVTPAIAGTLQRGTVLARSGDDVIAAQAGYGRGSVTLVGFNPATSWIADSSAADVLWRRLLPQASSPTLNPLVLPDDSQIVYSLQNLPSIDLPPIEQLFVLLLAYVALIGPINYLVLRRLDRREWAWLTIPALVGVFAVTSYGLGATLKGSDVIVNQVAIVRAAPEAGRGIGQVYVGVYSPSRRTFEVRVPGGALLSNATSQSMFGQAEQPLDVLFGASVARLRNFEVGFGVLRGFRAEVPADAPIIESDLRLVRGKLQGTVVNRSDTVLQNVAVVFGGGVAVLPTLEPGATREIDIDTSSSSFFGYGLSERIFGSTFPRDPAEARRVYTRRAVVDQAFPYGSTMTGSGPLLLGWREGPVIDVQLAGESPNRVGDGLFVMPLAMTLDSQAVFGDQMITRTIVESDAAEGWGDGSGYYMSRGTMTIEARPQMFEGSFNPTLLELALTQGETRALRGTGDQTEPLPDDQQPDQEDPVGDGGDPIGTDNPGGGGGEPGGGGDDPFAPGEPFPRGFDPLPDYQLFDHAAQRWFEFPHPELSKSHVIANPERFVGEGGSVLIRFVNRGAGEMWEEQRYFTLLMRMEGTIE